MTTLAIIADDLTGAADAGGAFASAGFRTVVALAGAPETSADIIVRSTESRGGDSISAIEANSRATRELLHGEAPPAWVYKKIDSMLRGYPGEELHAVLDAIGDRRALVAPALPAQGRATLASRQIVAGRHITPDLMRLFGRNDLPARPVDIATVRQGHDAVARAIAALERGILIADAETTGDLATIAQAALASDLRVLAGSAGLARQLAHTLPGASAPAAAAVPASGPVLIVAGSRNPATAAQVAALAEAGIPVVRPARAVLEDAEPSIGSLVERLAGYLDRTGVAALTTAGLAPSARGADGVVEVLAATVAALAERALIGGLVLTGGDVAAGVLAGLGAHRIDLCGEIAPAIPWGTLRSTRLADVPVVTKAGSFGTPDALLRAVRHLGG